MDLNCCINCIIKHHEAQELYKEMYDEEITVPLLRNLHRLDCERISTHMNNLSEKMKRNGFSDFEKKGLISVIFEVGGNWDHIF